MTDFFFPANLKQLFFFKKESCVYSFSSLCTIWLLWIFSVYPLICFFWWFVICDLFVTSIYFRFWFSEWDFAFDFSSSCSLFFYYFYSYKLYIQNNFSHLIPWLSSAQLYSIKSFTLSPLCLMWSRVLRRGSFPLLPICRLFSLDQFLSYWKQEKLCILNLKCMGFWFYWI